MIAASLLAFAVVAPLGAGYDPTPEAKNDVMYGDAVTVGKGTARSYIVMDGDKPAEIGVALSEQALQGLPAHGGHGAHGPMVEYLLTLPAKNPTPYRFVELDWNPEGHEPKTIYTVPHFDFHFYTIPVEERNAIDQSNAKYAASARNIPAPEYMPAGYLSAAKAGNVSEELASVPRMGLHWVDPTSPELNGKPFTTTFIYGTWNGKLIFGEPMLTRAFLLSKPDFRAKVPVPQKATVAGLYASEYRVFWNAEAKEYRVALTGLTELK
ncbi:MAG: DUF5602 domain-containing protein [Longimicrobiales bacterium]